MERTWTIRDLDGSNERVVTLAEFKAIIAERSAAAKPISDALRRGDMGAVKAAQDAFRAIYK